MPSLLFHNAFFNAPPFITFTLIAILLGAAVYDIRTFTIPHVFSYLTIALFIFSIVHSGMSFSALPWHLLSVAIAFCIGFILFLLRVMGGGDVKLFAALALWFFPLGLIGLIFSITTTGVILSIAIAAYKFGTIKERTDHHLAFGDRIKTVRKLRIPYGPAIALGTLFYLIFSNNLGL